jgi:hypothetical protein
LKIIKKGETLGRLKANGEGQVKERRAKAIASKFHKSCVPTMLNHALRLCLRACLNALKLRDNTNIILSKSLVALSKSPPVGETLASLFFKSLPGEDFGGA